MRRNCLIAGLFTAALFAVPPADAQQSAPRVRLATLPTTAMGTITPSISLSEPAYILAVAIHNGGEIEVLSPALPGDAIRFEAAKSIRFPEFSSGFSSFSSYGLYGSGYRRSMFAGYDDVASTHGSVLVIASRMPFNFSAISDGVTWNEESLRQIMRYKAPSQAVTALGRALTQKGQAFGHDYVYFGRSGYSHFASSSFRGSNGCMDYSLSPYGSSNVASYFGILGAAYGGTILAGYGNGLRLVQVGTDGCGRPHYLLVPVQTLPPRDTVKIDSLVKPEFRSVAEGKYTGEEARRVYEDFVRNRNYSDTYVRLANSPVFSETEASTVVRPVTREEQANRAESYEKIRSAADHPINRMPVSREQPERQDNAPILRAEPVTRAEPINRAEPISRPEPVSRPEPISRNDPPVQRESRPAEVITVVKDN